jgi:hypothetical protein
MEQSEGNQSEKAEGRPAIKSSSAGQELVIPNPKLKLMDQVREVMRVEK